MGFSIPVHRVRVASWALGVISQVLITLNGLCREHDPANLVRNPTIS
jgi:hypothetical protein